MSAATDSPAARPGERLLKHSFLNAAGQGVPIAVAIVAVPLLIRSLGTERFGLLTLAWTVLGYASVLDLGVGRALTQVVAERRATTDSGALSRLVWSALLVLAAIGVTIALGAALGAPWLTTRALTISAPLRTEARAAFLVLALGLPLVVIGTGLRGVLEAYERFDLVNAVRIPVGISTFLGPLAVVPFTHSLAWCVATLLVARFAATVAQAVMVVRVLPSLRRQPAFNLDVLRPVARFGAWLTVSNVLSPLMTSADRFFIGALQSAAVVAYYTAPYEMVTRLMALVALAVATSLFPAFARWRDQTDARALFRRGIRLTFVGFVPLMIGIIVFAHPLLSLWLGADYADQSTVVLRILGAGVILNGLAQVPFAHIQAVGRSDITAKIHIAEFPLYLAAAVFLIRTQGVQGAALAWSARMLVDTVLLFLVSRRLLADDTPHLPLVEAANA